MSAFKQLVTSMFNNGGKISAAQQSQNIKCYVKESFPYFLVSDNTHYAQVYFTKKAVDDFTAKNPTRNITDLKGSCITITNWHLEMNKVDSQTVFTSYGGVEVRLIANAFSAVKDSNKFVLTTHPSNLYRDCEVKTTIQQFHHKHITAAAASAKAALPDISSFKNNGNVSQGVVSSTHQCGFKEGKCATVSMDSIFKQERGSAAFNNLNKSVSSGKVKVSGGVKKSSKTIKKGGAKKNVTGALMRSNTGANKRSAVLGAKGSMATPGNNNESGSANVHTMKDFKKMVSMVRNMKSQNRSNTPGKKSKK